MSSFCKCKSYSHVFSKNISIYAIFNDQSFNDTLTNDIVSFEQLDQGPVVQSVVSLTGLLRVISLTVLADSIYNILILHCKSYSHFFSKKFQYICVSLDVNFNESLPNDIVSFEQLGQITKVDFYCTVHNIMLLLWNGFLSKLCRHHSCFCRIGHCIELTKCKAFFMIFRLFNEIFT